MTTMRSSTSPDASSFLYFKPSPACYYKSLLRYPDLALAAHNNPASCKAAECEQQPAESTPGCCVTSLADKTVCRGKLASVVSPPMPTSRCRGLSHAAL